jgi:UDP-3-O-[3-hydroxymyristoyl] glucosamine N-acyltransferase
MDKRLSDYKGLAGLKVQRDGIFSVTGKLSTLHDSLCVPLRSAKYAEEVNANQRVTAVITTQEIAGLLDSRFAIGVADDPSTVHNEIHAKLAQNKDAELRSTSTKIDSSAVVHPSAVIADYGVEIGARAYIGPNVSLAPGVAVGEDCVLHAGVSLGVPGFNVGVFGGRQRITPPLGGVRLEPFVQLLSNVCVARAIYGGDTVLGGETVVDNLVYIAHDVHIGKRVQICALVNVLGRVIVGDYAYLGPSSVIRNGLTVGVRARVSIGAVVTRNVADNEVVSGNFAISHRQFLNHIRSIR